MASYFNILYHSSSGDSSSSDDSSSADDSSPSSPTAGSNSNRLMAGMVSNVNSLSTVNNYNVRPLMGRTENNSATYLSTGNPCLDLFFHVVPDSPAEEIRWRLNAAWVHDPLTTLKLIANLRGVRGTGKFDKEGFYTAVLWMHGQHPKTLACNVAALADFGYFKDLPEILFRLLEGADVRRERKEEWVKTKSEGRVRRREKRRMRRQARAPYQRGSSTALMANSRHRGGWRGRVSNTQKPKSIFKRDASTREIRIANELKRSKNEKEKASRLREEKKNELAIKAHARYTGDPDYRLLHDKVAEFFAERLKLDVEKLNSGDLKRISLAAKWCPSIDSAFDRATLLCESIGRRVFPREVYIEYEGVEEVHYAYRVRDRLRKEVLVPLRKALELPEVSMGANDWGSINYSRVASVAMTNYKEFFSKHDGDRFGEYLKDVMVGKKKIAAGALLRHEIILALRDEDGGEVAELQWKRMVADLLEKGKLRNCIAVSDVSGSMRGIPMEVSVALGVLVSELSEEPWKGNLITFSENPQLQNVKGESLIQKTEFVRRMEWGMNTDFQKVFDLILKVAVQGKLKPEDMIKRVFVFSDMEFDHASRSYYRASRNDWETDYMAIVRNFKEHGYGNAVPQIVFWNLRSSMSTPVPANQKGVSLVSGFSKNMMKIFLENDGAISPVTVMEAAISKEEYQKLVIVD